jgi:hypothetical protein
MGRNRTYRIKRNNSGFEEVNPVGTGSMSNGSDRW